MSRTKHDTYSKNRLMLNRFLLSLMTITPAIIGLGILLVGNGPFERLMTSLGFFVSGFTGVIIIIRKEIPIPIGSIQGKRAVVEGLLFTIVLWSIALYGLLFGP